DDAEDSRFAQMTCANQRREWMLAHGRKWIVTRVIPRAVKSMLRALVTRPIHVIRIVLNHLHIFSKPVEKRVQSEPTSIIRASETEARPVPDDVPRLLWFGHSGIPGASGLTDLQLIAEPL